MNNCHRAVKKSYRTSQTYRDNVRHFSLGGIICSSGKCARWQLQNSKQVSVVAWVHK